LFHLQHKRLEQAITLAGGKALLKETGDMSGSDDNMLTDQNTLVMSVDMKSGISEEKEVWIGHVGDVLKRLVTCITGPLKQYKT
jgi:hypothetical protein